jgi:S-adenosylmethionine/arginine decarboxylase-like enzyme
MEELDIEGGRLGSADPEKAISYIIRNLKPERHEVFTVDRTQKRIE